MTWWQNWTSMPLCIIRWSKMWQPEFFEESVGLKALFLCCSICISSQCVSTQLKVLVITIKSLKFRIWMLEGLSEMYLPMYSAYLLKPCSHVLPLVGMRIRPIWVATFQGSIDAASTALWGLAAATAETLFTLPVFGGSSKTWKCHANCKSVVGIYVYRHLQVSWSGQCPP